MSVNETVNSILTQLKNNGMNEPIGYENSNFKPPALGPYIIVAIDNLATVIADNCRLVKKIAVHLDYYVMENTGTYVLNNRMEELAAIVNPIVTPYEPEYSIDAVEIINGGDAGNGRYYNTLKIDVSIYQ
jgi:hypothetical protein